jgi:hypothetical protein
MSAAKTPQVVEPEEFIPILDYHFAGNDVTVSNKRLLIENLRRRAVIYLAAQAVGINKLTVYRWRDSDPQFAAAMAEAMEDAKEIMENSVYEDALNGNTLLKMFWLKRHDPNYRDKVQVDVNIVMQEIKERMQQLGVRELPSIGAEFVDNMDSMDST